jgi:hypothetical protein
VGGVRGRRGGERGRGMDGEGVVLGRRYRERERERMYHSTAYEYYDYYMRDYYYISHGVSCHGIVGPREIGSGLREICSDPHEAYRGCRGRAGRGGGGGTGVPPCVPPP